jgi:hypothetical protein
MSVATVGVSVNPNARRDQAGANLRPVAPVRKGGVRVIATLSFGLLVEIRSATKKGDVVGKYTIARIPNDFGDAFEIVSVPEEGVDCTQRAETRHVNLSDAGSTCDCEDHVYARTACKHIRSAMVLSDAGRI